MSKITLFGAAFDPPHLGHRQIVISLLQQKLANEVWLLPVGEHAFAKPLSAAKKRLDFLKALVLDLPDNLQPKVRIEKIELEQTGTSYSYQTLQTLARKFPEHKFSFVIGSDNLARFNEWDNYQQMLREFPFYVYPRADYPLEPILPGMKLMVDVKKVDVSSTQVRERQAAGQRVDDLVSPRVAALLE